MSVGSIANIEKSIGMSYVENGRSVENFNSTGRRVDTSLFTPDYESMQKVPLVDASIRHYFSPSCETCLLIVRSSLITPAIDNDLMPRLAVQEVGLPQCMLLRLNVRF